MDKGAVLVAGGAGYIGSHACKALAARGYLPVTLDDFSTGHRSAVRYGPLVEGDISSAESVSRIVADFDIRGAMHFAAKSLVAASVRDPLHYYSENVGKGVRFLGNLQASGVRNVLFSSTAAVYGDPMSAQGLTESAPKTPINPYGATKLAVEDALRWSSIASGGRHAVLRYFNAAGADIDGEIGEDHDPETHLVPLAVGAALGLRPPLNVFGTDYETPDGTAIRDYVHVNDLADAHLVVFERMLAGQQAQVFNVGAGRGYSVMEVIAAVSGAVDGQVPHELAPRRAGDPPVLVADITALKRVGWSPHRSDLETIVKSAVRWHRSQSAPQTVSQLRLG